MVELLGDNFIAITTNLTTLLVAIILPGLTLFGIIVLFMFGKKILKKIVGKDEDDKGGD